MTLLSWILILVNCLVYLAFKGMATVGNRVLGKETLHRRWVGALGVIAFAALTAWFARAYLVNDDLQSNLSDVQQARYAGRIIGFFLAPSIVVLAVVAFRGWRNTRKRENARAAVQA